MSLKIPLFSLINFARNAKNKIKNKIEIFSSAKFKLKSKLNILYSFHSEYVKCSWKLSSVDKRELDYKKISCLAIRIYDITSQHSNRSRRSCVMKEIEINKKAIECLIPLPINDGILLADMGYRDSKGQWFGLCSQVIKLLDRQKK